MLTFSVLGLTDLMGTGDTYIQQKTASSLVQVMAWRQCGAKPLPEPITTYCQLHHQEQTSEAEPNDQQFIILEK